MTTTTFTELGLAEPLLRALNDAQYINPTPIQAQTIPVLLEGRDLLGLAETGTGKTAAFVLPILQKLAGEGRTQPGAPRALILAPTRELAIQIGESIAAYGRHLRISHTVIFGGVGQRPQVNAIARGVDILVATPGRLLDLIDQRHLRLGNVQTFVLDEADRMLDMGFVRDVRRILKLVPVKRHSLLFSATMPDDIAKLAAEFLTNPARVEIARAGKTVDRIDQKVMFVPTSVKRDVLARLLQDAEMRRVIVFTRTKRGADRVSKAIEMIGVGVHAIHGNKSQGQRQSALDSFRKGFTRVLVATDIAARGIDIDEITHVVNYELPNIPESYVHRIGRTARAGASGVAIALCAPDEREYLRDIEKLIKRRLDVVPVPEGLQRTAPVEEVREPAAERPERRPQRGRPARGGDGGGRPHHRDGAPRGDRSEGGRPRREEGRRPAVAGERQGFREGDRHGARAHHRRDERQGEHRREARGEHRGEARGEHRGEVRGEPRGERRFERHGADRRNGHDRGEGHGHRNGGPQNGSGRPPRQAEGRRNGEAPRNGRGGQNGSASSDAPQPWRNWTRGDEFPRQRPDGAGNGSGREEGAREGRKEHRGAGRAPHAKGHRGGAGQRRSDRGDQGRGRAAR